jgi:hypothetical protein
MTTPPTDIDYTRDCIREMNRLSMTAQGIVHTLMSGDCLSEEDKNARNRLCIMMRCGDMLASLSVFQAELSLVRIKDPEARNKKMLEILSIVRRYRHGPECW